MKAASWCSGFAPLASAFPPEVIAWLKSDTNSFATSPTASTFTLLVAAT